MGKRRETAAPAANDPQYLTPQELRDRFRGKVALRTISNWRSLGIGPKFTKVGGRVMYPLAEVETWERSRTANSTR